MKFSQLFVLGIVLYLESVVAAPLMALERDVAEQAAQVNAIERGTLNQRSSSGAEFVNIAQSSESLDIVKRGRGGYQVVDGGVVEVEGEGQTTSKVKRGRGGYQVVDGGLVEVEGEGQTTSKDKRGRGAYQVVDGGLVEVEGEGN